MEVTAKRETYERLDAEVRPWLAHYPADVPHTLSYPNTTIDHILDRTVAKHGGADAVVFQGYTLSWQDVGELSDRLAFSLAALGVRKGDRVMLLFPNVPHFVIAYFAVLKLGAIVLAANPLSVQREIENQVRETGARVILTLDVLYEKVPHAWRALGVRHVVVGGVSDLLPGYVRFLGDLVHTLDSWATRTAPGTSPVAVRKDAAIAALEKRVPMLTRLRGIPRPETPIPFGGGVHRFRTLLAEPKRVPRPHISPSDPAVLLFTGGTTGIPKAVTLTHANLIANALQIRSWFPDLKDGRETILAILPFFHAYGLTLAMNAGLILAARSVLIPRVVLQDIFEAIRRFRPTALPGVPAIFISLVNSERTRHDDLHSIRICVSGGAPLPLEIKQQFEEITGGHLYEGYGLTEASPLSHAHPHSGFVPEGSIGFPVPDTDARIVDDEGRPVPTGEIGELIIRGPQVMAGYWNRPEDTAEVLRDGWLHTGDMARMDERGFFYIVDRQKDIIITGGENVYPREIEEVLYGHPKVKEAAVVGVPHSYGGEIAKAFIVLKDGESATKADIVRWLGDHLSKYKVPRAVEFRESLPKSPMGKILRRELAAEEAERARRRGARRGGRTDRDA